MPCLDATQHKAFLGLVKQVNVGVISQYAKVFGGVATHSEVEKAGEATLTRFYSDNKENLNMLRYKIFCEKVATNQIYVEPKMLPPSYQHSMLQNTIVFVCITKFRNGWEK